MGWRMGWRMSERQGGIQGPHFLFFLQLAHSPHLVLGRIVGAHPCRGWTGKEWSLFSIGISNSLLLGWWWVRRGSIDNAGGAALVATIGKQPHAGDTGAPLGTKGHRQYIGRSKVHSKR